MSIETTNPCLELTADQFDEMLEASETPQQHRRTEPEVVDALIVNEDVARMLAEGFSVREISHRTGISDGAIRRRLRTGPMLDLLKRESRRIMRHLSGRDLDKEKYLGLATAASVMIDKALLLEGQPNAITRNVSETTVRRITLLLHGQIAGGAGEIQSGAHAEIDSPAVPAIPEETGAGGEGGSPADDSGSDLL